MVQHRVILNDKLSPILTLDPKKSLSNQLRVKLRLNPNMIINFKREADEEFEPLDPDATLEELKVDPSSILYISIPRRSSLIPRLLMIAGMAALLVALIVLRAPILKYIISPVATTSPTIPSAPTVESSAPTTAASTKIVPQDRTAEPDDTAAPSSTSTPPTVTDPSATSVADAPTTIPPPLNP